MFILLKVSRNPHDSILRGATLFRIVNWNIRAVEDTLAIYSLSDSSESRWHTCRVLEITASVLASSISLIDSAVAMSWLLTTRFSCFPKFLFQLLSDSMAARESQTSTNEAVDIPPSPYDQLQRGYYEGRFNLVSGQHQRELFHQHFCLA